MQNYIAINTGSFRAKSGHRYRIQVGHSYTEQNKGDFDGQVGIFFAEPESETPKENKQTSKKKSANKDT